MRNHSSAAAVGNAGFILMEIMLSLVILITGLVAVLRSYRTSLRVDEESATRLEATLLMESQLVEMDYTGQLNADLGAGSGLGRLSWNDATLGSDPHLGQEHRVSLTWGEGRHGHTIEQSIYTRH